MNPLLEVRGLLVQREGRTVLEVDELIVLRGEVLAVVGPNGAGKSTLFLALARLLKLQRGAMTFRWAACPRTGPAGVPPQDRSRVAGTAADGPVCAGKCFARIDFSRPSPEGGARGRCSPGSSV